MKKADKNAVASEDPYKINVLLAYDSVGTCGAILDMFDRISSRLRAKKLFNVNAFRFGLLEKMDPFKCSAAGAGAADLVMVAFGADGAPGAGLLRWLEDWAQQHEGQDSALGFLPIGVNAEQSVRRAVRSLKRIAARHGLRFIYGAEAGLDLPPMLGIRLPEPGSLDLTQRRQDAEAQRKRVIFGDLGWHFRIRFASLRLRV